MSFNNEQQNEQKLFFKLLHNSFLLWSTADTLFMNFLFKFNWVAESNVISDSGSFYLNGMGAAEVQKISVKVVCMMMAHDIK